MQYCRIPWASINSTSSPSKSPTSHVRDQVTHGTCPIYPNHLSSTVKTSAGLLDGTGKADVESRGEIYYVQELKHLFV